jgi:hypothetical protein
MILPSSTATSDPVLRTCDEFFKSNLLGILLLCLLEARITIIRPIHNTYTDEHEIPSLDYLYRSIGPAWIARSSL